MTTAIDQHTIGATPAEAPVSLAAPVLAFAGAPNPVDERRYYVLHMMGALFPMTAGILLYGWRAIGLVAVVLLTTAVAVRVWRVIGRRGAALHMSQALWLALLLALMLPPHLLTTANPAGYSDDVYTWAILPGVSILLVALLWLIGGAGFTRVQPLLLAYLALILLYNPLLAPRMVLHRQRLVSGDLLRVESSGRGAREEAWIYEKSPTDSKNKHDALSVEATAADRLSEFTLGTRAQKRSFVTMESLLRDGMPPLEDLVVGGHPGPLGTSSAIAVIIGGLFLLYRGLIDYRIPLLTVVFTFLALLVLPVPIIISTAGAQYRPLALPRAHLDWGQVITFVNYEIMASPLLFVAFFLATSSSIAPINGKAKACFAMFLGICSAAGQLYIGPAYGPYIALLLVGLLTPTLDHLSGVERRL